MSSSAGGVASSAGSLRIALAGVDLAVLVGVLGAVGHAAVVGVGSTMLVWVAGSASGRKWPAPTSVSACGVVTPTSVPSNRPSLSLSGSSALIRPSPSVSSA
jgi:hypothetical protein